MNSNRPILGAVALVAVVIAGLAAVDKSLASIERAELMGSADRSYRKGIDFLRRGMAAQAVEPLRQAHATERDSPVYTLSLIEALTAVSKTDEARQLADEILASHPNDGEANLITARLMVKQGNLEDADAYYHRAIYGMWSSDAATHEVAARLELAEMLLRENARQRLLGELISLSSEAGDDLALKRQIGHLYLMADSPARAVEMFREVLEHARHDAKALTDLGEAELENGEYRAARASFQQASFYDPAAALEPRLRLLTEVTALDPTPRRLTSGEKYSRSTRILALAKGDLDSRIASSEQRGRISAETQQLLTQAAGDLAREAPAHANNEMAEQELDLAERIWKARLAMFGPSTSAEEEPLRLVMERLAS